MGHHTNNRAFTIVELVIVITVIAILAVVSAVSYNGITKRAYNTQVMGGVSTYYDAIVSYKVSKGEYPSTQREIDGQSIAMTCLGRGYPSQACGQVTGVNVYEDTVFNAQLKAYMKSETRPVSNMTLPVPGETYIGAVYGIDTTTASSTGYGRVIEYALHGKNVSCGIKDAWAYSSSANATACEILLEEVSF